MALMVFGLGAPFALALPQDGASARLFVSQAKVLVRFVRMTRLEGLNGRGFLRRSCVCCATVLMSMMRIFSRPTMT
jgi:hypothetical protein